MRKQPTDKSLSNSDTNPEGHEPKGGARDEGGGEHTHDALQAPCMPSWVTPFTGAGTWRRTDVGQVTANLVQGM